MKMTVDKREYEKPNGNRNTTAKQKSYQTKTDFTTQQCRVGILKGATNVIIT